MKKYVFIILGLFLLTGCNKEYKTTCTGVISEENTEYTLNVTIHYDNDNHVTALDYEMKYNDEDTFNLACESSQDKNPTCENKTVSYTESDDITKNFTKDDVIKLLYVIGANVCK